jgi:hypothetical protein
MLPSSVVDREIGDQLSPPKSWVGHRSPRITRQPIKPSGDNACGNACGDMKQFGVIARHMEFSASMRRPRQRPSIHSHNQTETLPLVATLAVNGVVCYSLICAQHGRAPLAGGQNEAARIHHLTRRCNSRMPPHCAGAANRPGAPDDRLVSFHLKRLLNGASGPRIELP